MNFIFSQRLQKLSFFNFQFLNYISPPSSIPNELISSISRYWEANLQLDQIRIGMAGSSSSAAAVILNNRRRRMRRRRDYDSSAGGGFGN
ncbi:hypothetical protein LINGRAHAP2_LOCUS22758 [Linum grandiflorum]